MSNLKNLVDEITNIKNELVSCHADLKTKLKAKDVDVLETDKMADLIIKAGNLFYPVIAYGDEISYSSVSTSVGIKSTKYVKLRTFNTFSTLGSSQYKIKSVKFSTFLSTNVQDHGATRYLYLKMVVKDGSEEVISKEFTLTIWKGYTDSATYSIEIPYPKTSYIVEIYGKSSTTYSNSDAGFIGNSTLSGKVAYI